MQTSALPWDCAAILAALAVILPWRGTVRIRQVLGRPAFGTSDRMSMYRSTMVFQWMAAGVTAWRTDARGWSLSSLGLVLGDPALTLGVGVTLALLLTLFQLASLRQLSRNPAARRGIPYEMLRKVMPQSSKEVLPFVALVATVSVCEEFLFRGFVFAALARLFHDSVSAAACGSAALFSAGHLYQGRRGLVSTFILGLIFAAVRVWTGSLAPCILAHLATDLIAGIAGPRLLARVSTAESAIVYL